MVVEYMGDIVVEWFSYKVILRERETVAVFFPVYWTILGLRTEKGSSSSSVV